jgi:hypothetical protein
VADEVEYQVDRVPDVDEQIRALAKKAGRAGRKQQLLVALKTALHQLKTRPADWGDPERRTRKKTG